MSYMKLKKGDLLIPGQRVKVDLTGRGDFATGHIVQKTAPKSENNYQRLYQVVINEYREIKPLNKMRTMNVPEDLIFPF